MGGVFKNCTLHEALAVLEEDSDYEVDSIFPEPNVHSDEDSGDGDDGAFVNNLSGRQLNARCDVVLSFSSVSTLRRSRRLQRQRSVSPPLDFTAPSTSNVVSGRKRGTAVARANRRGRGKTNRGSQSRVVENITGGKRARSVDISSDSVSSDEEPEETEPRAKKQKKGRSWVHEDATREPPLFPEGNYTKFRELSPVELLELFLGDEDQISQLDFRRHIVQTYLMRFRNLPRGPGRPQTSRQSQTGHQVSDDIRFDGIAHYLVPCPEGARRRCAFEYCKSQSRLQCSKCNVGLCAKCNYKFHTQ